MHKLSGWCTRTTGVKRLNIYIHIVWCNKRNKKDQTRGKFNIHVFDDFIQACFPDMRCSASSFLKNDGRHQMISWDDIKERYREEARNSPQHAI